MPKRVKEDQFGHEIKSLQNKKAKLNDNIDVLNKLIHKNPNEELEQRNFMKRIKNMLKYVIFSVEENDQKKTDFDPITHKIE